MEADESLRPYVRIPVHPMSHQLQIWKNNEDWAGKTNTDDRRRLQNRLNQRAYS